MNFYEKIKTAVEVASKNYTNKESFDKACEELEKGKEIYISLSCIGHTLHSIVQDSYKVDLKKKYESRLEIEFVEIGYRYYYFYKLKRD